MPTLRELGEIEALRRLMAARGAGPGVVVGPGDDAAVLSLTAGSDLIATTDTFVEGRHYRLDWLAPAEAGARLVAANLSDLAAMAARPLWALLSMGLRPEHDVDALLAFQSGVAGALEVHGAGIVGGNLAAARGAEWFGLTLLGEAPRGRAWTRSGARVGDFLALTGHPGRAGAGLRLALQLGARARAAAWRPLIDAWLHPTPRIALARALAATGGVTAAIDLSDGLAGDLAQLCDRSGVGAEVDVRALQEDEHLSRAAAALSESEEALRFGPSDDYELVLAVDPEKGEDVAAVARRLGVSLTLAGRFVEGSGVGLGPERRPPAVRGYDHFADGSREAPER